MNVKARTSPPKGRNITLDVACIVNHRQHMMTSNEECIQHMEEDYWNDEARLGLKQASRRNPESHVSTNAFWKVSPNKMKVDLYGDICNESNLIDCFRVR